MYIALFKDNLGLPRAWAIAPTMEAARECVREQLKKYRAGISYDSLVQEPFHCEIIELLAGM